MLTLKKDIEQTNKNTKFTKKLQDMLKQLDYFDKDYIPNGIFGNLTDLTIKQFQNKNNLLADGVVGNKTWNKILSLYYLGDFNGDLFWVHAREGHNGTPYWPGGESGITVDPGIDLGYFSYKNFEALYKNILNDEEIHILNMCTEMRGEQAKKYYNENKEEIKSVKISSEDAELIFPFASIPYWIKIKNRFNINNIIEEIPPCIHTVLLSLSYNRGANNKNLSVLQMPILNKNWNDFAYVVENMQQDHPLEGIRKRRRMEGQYIKDNL